MDNELAKIRRSLRINRILLLLVLALFVFIIVGMYIEFAQVARIYSTYKPAINSLAKMDLSQITSQINSLNVPELTERVNKLDANLANLAAAFKDLKEVMEPISALATKKQQ